MAQTRRKFSLSRISPSPTTTTTPKPTMQAYRDANGEVKYAPLTAHSTQQYDSDGEPLITSISRSDIDEDAMKRFTATGKPMTKQEPSAWGNWAGDMYSLPQLLPQRYTDESVVPAIITDVIPSPKDPAAPTSSSSPEEGSKVRSFMKHFKGERKSSVGTDGKMTKVVFMKRKDYLRYFARDEQGNYVGSEEYRRWTENELDERFGEFRPKKMSDTVSSPTGFIPVAIRNKH